MINSEYLSLPRCSKAFQNKQQSSGHKPPTALMWPPPLQFSMREQASRTESQKLARLQGSSNHPPRSGLPQPPERSLRAPGRRWSLSEIAGQSASLRAHPEQMKSLSPHSPLKYLKTTCLGSTSTTCHMSSRVVLFPLHSQCAQALSPSLVALLGTHSVPSTKDATVLPKLVHPK